MTLLAGLRVLVPLTGSGRRQLVDALERHGARVRTAVLARITVAPGAAAAADRLARGGVAWLALTSSHAVDALAEASGGALAALVGQARTSRAEPGAVAHPGPGPGPLRVAAVGPATAAALRAHGITADLVPPDRSATGLLTAWPAQVSRGAVVVPHGDLAEGTLVDGLRARGWAVEPFVAYRNEPGPPLDAALRDDLAEGRVDVVVLTSGSVAARLLAQVRLAPGTRVVALGPRTRDALTGLGLEIDATSTGPETAAVLAAVTVAARSTPRPQETA